MTVRIKMRRLLANILSRLKLRTTISREEAIRIASEKRTSKFTSYPNKSKTESLEEAESKCTSTNSGLK